MTDQRHDQRPLETADLQARTDDRMDDRLDDRMDDRTDDRYDEMSDGDLRGGDTRDEAPFADAPYEGSTRDDTTYNSAEVPAGSTDRYAQQVDEPRDGEPMSSGRDTYVAGEPTEQFAQDSARHSTSDGMGTGAMGTADTVNTTDAAADDTAQLFTGEEVDRFRTEWRGLQSDFVDSPRDAVQHADQLVAQVIQSLTTTFADQKRSLEGQWGEGEQVETEELRVALRQYRAFFDKLLTV